MADRLASTELQLRTRDGRPGGPHAAPSPDGGPPTDAAGEDLVERAVWHTACTLHRRLDELGIEHLWSDEGPGIHDWPYWSADLAATLPAIAARFAGSSIR